MEELIGFYTLTVLIAIFQFLNFFPNFAESNYIHMISIGFLLILLTTISFSNFIYKGDTTLPDFWLYLIPMIPVFLPILGFTFIQFSIKKHKKNYGLEDDKLYGPDLSWKYFGLNLFYCGIVMTYIVYLHRITNNSNIKHDNIMLLASFLFILLEILIYLMWHDYQITLKKQADG